MTRPSRSSLARCAASAAAVWLVFFSSGRHVAYGGDDSVVLMPLFGGGLAESLGRFLRPLEYAVAFLSLQADAPLWLGVSALAYVATCVGTLSLLCLVNPDSTPPLWQILVCAATPLAAQTYFQIDTVSQALANVFTVSYVIVSLRAITSTEPEAVARGGWRMVALAALCVLSKETTYGIVFLGCLLILFRHGRRMIPACGVIVGLLIAAVLWRVFYQYGDIAADSGFGFKLNPLYWILSFLFSLIVAAAPLPTSITLSGAFATHPALIAIVVLGAAVLSLGLLAYFRSPLLMLRAMRRSSSLIDFRNVHLLLVLYLLASVVPTVFFKAAELYASQMTPILKVLLLSIPVASPLLARAFWTACAALWVLASSVNLMYYSVATGYDPRGSALYAPIGKAVANAPRVYSIYHRGIYADDTYPGDGGCTLSRRSPGLCLPDSVSSGFPRRL